MNGQPGHMCSHTVDDAKFPVRHKSLKTYYEQDDTNMHNFVPVHSPIWAAGNRITR